MRSILVVVVFGILAAACSKEPAQTAPQATPPPAAAVQSPPAPAPVDPVQDAVQDAAKLAEYIDPRPECGQFKDRLMAASEGSPASDTMAKDFATVMADAKAAGCTVAH